MKTYRGSILAAAVLFATLPNGGCGDADDYAQTAGIALTASVGSAIVKHEVVFTVTTSFPDPTATVPTAAAANSSALRAPVINQCDPALEYQVSGAGLDQGWTPLPGTTAVRTFILKPREVSPLIVIARGKCIGSMEDWKYSTAVNVTITPPIALGLPALSLTANPSSVVVGNPVTFNLSSDKPLDCTVRMKYQYSGAGFGVTTVDPATAGQFILTPGSVGTLTVTASGWCTQSPAAISVVTAPVTVTAVVAPTPLTPTSVTLTAVTPSPYDRSVGGGVTFTLNAVTPVGCTLVLSRQHTGVTVVEPSPVNPTAIGTYTINPTSDGTLIISASGWCSENTAGVILATPLSYAVVP